MIFKRLRIPAATQPTDASESMLRHAKAARVFNRMVMKLNLASCFDRAIPQFKGSAQGSGAEAGLALNYLMPGERPENETGRLLYAIILNKIEAAEIRAMDRLQQRRLLSQAIGLRNSRDSVIQKDKN